MKTWRCLHREIASSGTPRNDGIRRVLGACWRWGVMLLLVAGAVEAWAEEQMPEALAPLHLEGKIGKSLRVVMDLDFSWGKDAKGQWDATAKGRYFYTRYRKEIGVVGTLRGAQLTLAEGGDGGHIVAGFAGTLAEGQYRGEWSLMDESRALAFDLKVCPLRIGPPSKKLPKRSHDSDSPEGCEVMPPTSDKDASFWQLNLSGGMECHYRIHPALPMYHFRLRTKEDSIITGVDVVLGSRRVFRQSLIADSWTLYNQSEKDDVFEALDMNFDGYRDVRLLVDIPASGNSTYIVWLFNPSTGYFQYSSGLSSLSGPEFDPATKTAGWHWHIGAGERVAGTCRVDSDGTVTSVRSDSTLRTSDTNQLVRTVKELRDGKMVEVSREVVE